MTSTAGAPPRPRPPPAGGVPPCANDDDAASESPRATMIGAERRVTGVMGREGGWWDGHKELVAIEMRQRPWRVLPPAVSSSIRTLALIWHTDRTDLH